MTAFDEAMRFVLKAEGGWYDGTGPHDKNPTNYGITQRTYDLYRKTMKPALAKRSVRLIAADEVWAIYRILYWTKGKCDKLAERSEMLATIHFDACVNHGVASPNSDLSAGAIELLQRTVGVTDDGVFGPKTWGAFCELLADDGEVHLANKYLSIREGQYRHLAKKAPNTLGLNLHGWLRRLEKLRGFLKVGVC
jgi:lysozyme family protein